MHEPQDVDNRFRHYAVNRAQLTLSDKVPFVFARGTPQVEDSFAMIRLARGLSEDAFLAGAHCYTVINTNSPRQLDIPMAQGIIDFARAGQVSIITPFCLAGAMAPITVAGALTLQHAEALAGLTLAQIVRPGAPVVYGSFSSNVDMKWVRRPSARRSTSRRRWGLASWRASPACPGVRAVAAPPTFLMRRQPTRRSSHCGARCWQAPPSASMPPDGSKAA
ncbi:hypothetical protein AJ88_08285 [Mesorhizobium amorphae CCBAU 01583]|nr:hypothetical protein AJ88_08285 [Mesorhizobium amorphae CCBAU 01583]